MGEIRVMGFGTGVWVLSNEVDIGLKIVAVSISFIHMEVCSRGERDWLLTAVYANPHQVREGSSGIKCMCWRSRSRER